MFFVNTVQQPLLWLSIGALVWFFPAVRPTGKLKTRGSLHFWSFCFAFIMIVVQVLAGLVDGLGKSPYDHSAFGLISNVLIVGSVLVGRELARHYLVNSITREENYRVFLAVTILMTIISFPITKYSGLISYEEIAKFLAQFLVPEFTKNLLATVLVFYGGPLASIIFIGTLEAFHWLSPILPDLKWITAALVGILTPVFLLSYVQIIYEDETRKRRRDKEQEENPLSWIITTLISIGIVWFSVGVFPIYPSVIATGSMIPMIQPGDVILVDKKIDVMRLATGDVIQFRRDDILISHRIIEVIEKDGIKSYKTQGDNNSGPDRELVKPENIKGSIIKVVPNIGWPTLLIKSDKDIPMDDIVF
ncbi:signal peptidase I [Desulfitobacterium sp. THU1]|uniref:signal peptidase I n=1 Tax=Desulfitobacterium sp. THU1 TaxID=3138072 RepID=UPI00311E4D77